MSGNASIACGIVQSSVDAREVLVDGVEERLLLGRIGRHGAVEASAAPARRRGRSGAVNAASGSLVVLSMLNVSAWSLAVVLPSYGRGDRPAEVLDDRRRRRRRVDAAGEPGVRLVHREVARLELVALGRAGRCWIWFVLGDEVVLPDAVVEPLLAGPDRVRDLRRSCRRRRGTSWRRTGTPRRSGLLSAYCDVEAPLDDRSSASKSELVASLPVLSTVSFMARLADGGHVPGLALVHVA